MANPQVEIAGWRIDPEHAAFMVAASAPLRVMKEEIAR